MTTVNRAVPPIIRPIEPFALPTPRRTALANGAPVFYFDNPNLDLIHLLLQISTWQRFAPHLLCWRTSDFLKADGRPAIRILKGI